MAENKEATKSETTKGPAPVVNKKIVETMPKPEVKVVGEPKVKKERAPKVSKAGTNFIGLKPFTAGEKVPLQCQQILAIIDAAPEKTINRENLLAEMAKVVVTRQPIERILGFYQSRMVSAGYVRIVPIVAVVAAAKVEAAKA